MYLVKVRKTLRETLRGEDVRIVRQPVGLHARDVRVRCKARDCARIARMIEAAGLIVFHPTHERTHIDVTG